jgi:hypothetical protein
MMSRIFMLSLLIALLLVVPVYPVQAQGGDGTETGDPAVPKLDPGAMASALTLLAGGVLGRVVAVTEEHPRCVRHRANPLRRSLVESASRLLHYQAYGLDVQWRDSRAVDGRHSPKDGRMLPRPVRIARGPARLQRPDCQVE